MALSKPTIKLADNVRLELNQLLSNIAQLEQDATMQDQAMVPGMDSVIARCQNCRDRIAAFKAVNFPNKK